MRMSKDEFVERFILDLTRKKKSVPKRPKPRLGTHQTNQLQYSTKGAKCQEGGGKVLCHITIPARIAAQTSIPAKNAIAT